ncbi:hypothetical protein N9M65_01870 [Luminiphilus sp.]|nr:hypothetical protein [Luminiphilus sp.]
MTFLPYPLTNIIRNNFWAVFVNQSFTLIALIGIVGAGLFATARPVERPLSECHAMQYLLLVAVSLTLMFMLPQLVTTYAERFAVPNSDTGNSRFLLSVGPVVLLGMGFQFRCADRLLFDTKLKSCNRPSL